MTTEFELTLLLPAFQVKAFLQAPMEGVVLESFGAGNMPSNRPDLNEALREAARRGVIILNITQCYNGSISHDYATGKVMSNYIIS